MTMVIGMHCRDFVLIGADSRSMQLDNDGVTWNIDDAEEKVFKTGIGVLSGAGYWSAIALTRLHMIGAVAPDDIQVGIRGAFEQLEGQRPAQEVANARVATHLMQSYVDAADGSLVLATVGPENNYAGTRVNVFEHALFSPLGLPQDVEDQLNAQISGSIDATQRDNAVPFGQRAEQAARIIQVAMHFVGARLNTISPRTYQLGLLHQTPLIQVCEITDDVTNVRWRAAERPFGY